MRWWYNFSNVDSCFIEYSKKINNRYNFIFILLSLRHIIHPYSSTTLEKYWNKCRAFAEISLARFFRQNEQFKNKTTTKMFIYKCVKITNIGLCVYTADVMFIGIWWMVEPAVFFLLRKINVSWLVPIWLLFSSLCRVLSDRYRIRPVATKIDFNP